MCSRVGCGRWAFAIDRSHPGHRGKTFTLRRSAPMSKGESLLYWGVWCQARQTFPSIWLGVARRALASLRDRHFGPSTMGIRRMRRNDLGDVLAVRLDGRHKAFHELTSPIVPAGDIAPPVGGIQVCSCCIESRTALSRHNFFPRPAKLSVVNPHPMHDDRHSSCYGDNRALHSSTPGYLHAPGLEP